MRATFFDNNHPIKIDFYEPPNPTGRRTPAIILAHGSGGNIGFWFEQMTPYLNQAGIALYAPHYFDRTGTARADLATITDGIHVPLWLGTLESALQWVAARPTVDPSRIALIGISLGSFLSLGLAAQHSASSETAMQSAIRAVVDIAGGLVSPYSEQATGLFPPTLIFHGEEDQTVPVSFAHAIDTRLGELNVTHETHLLPNEGHLFSPMGYMQVLLSMRSFFSRHL